MAELVGPLALNLHEQGATEEPLRIAAALRWLQSHPGWLLILDNVDSEKAAGAVEELLPKLPGGHVLITSRIAIWSDHIVPLEVDVLSHDAAAAFLLEKTESRGNRGRVPQESDKVDASRLAEELDGLALALEQAGAYITSQRISLVEYLQRWKAHEAAVQEWHRPRKMSYPQSIAVTWQTTLDQLSPQAVGLLNVLAWFSPDLIPTEVLEFSEPVSVGVTGTTLDATSWREALMELADFNMVRWDTKRRAVSVHRVVQEILRNRQTEPIEPLTIALNQLAASIPKQEPEDVRTWPVWEALRPHVQFTTTEADLAGIAEPTRYLMTGLGIFLRKNALYDAAEALKRRALAIGEIAYGPRSLEVAGDLNGLGLLLQETCHLDEAEQVFRRAIKIEEQVLGKDHPNLARSLHNLARFLRATYRLDEAEPIMRQVLAMAEKHERPDHTSVALALSNLALLLHMKHDWQEAEPLMRRALDINERAYGPAHPEVVRDLENLAQVLQATGRQPDAMQLMRRSLKIEKVAFGNHHIAVALTYRSLAGMLKENGALADAELALGHAIQAHEQACGPDHPEVALDLVYMAGILQATDRATDAEATLRRAIDMLTRFNKSHQREHPYRRHALLNYFRLLEETGVSRSEIETRFSQATGGEYPVVPKDS